MSRSGRASGHHSPSTTTSTGSLSRSSPTSSIHSSGGGGGAGNNVGDHLPVLGLPVRPLGTPPSASLVSRKSYHPADGNAAGTPGGGDGTTPGGGSGSSGYAGSSSQQHRLPKLFVLIEMNQWNRVEERVRRHPREAARWATVRKGRPLSAAPTTPSGGAGGAGAGTSGGISTPERYGPSSSSLAELQGGTPSSVVTAGTSSPGMTTPERQISRVQCKALHHACQKLRSVYSMPVPPPKPSSSSSKSKSSSSNVISGVTYASGADGRVEGKDEEKNEEEEEADPYVSACRAIIALVEAHPRAAGERESRHGCLPLHLAAFGMCGSTGGPHHHQQQQQPQHQPQSAGTPSSSSGGGTPLLGKMARPGMMVARESSAPVDLDEMLSGEDEDDDGESSSSSSSAATDDDAIRPPPTPASTVHSASAPSSPAMDVDEMADEMIGVQTCKSDPISLAGSLAESLTGNACGMMTVPKVTRPPRMSSSAGRMANYSGGGGGHHRRGHSHDTHDFSLMGMSQVIQSETYGSRKDRSSGGVRRPAPISTQSRAQSAPVKGLTSSSSAGGVSYVVSTTTSSTRRDHYSLLVLNALLDAYPRAVKTDSEGGRLPLHTAISGQASAKVVRTLLRAYPDASRQRTKDGYLPLHLAAHWGISSLDVVSALLKAYPDAIQGRNRFERTPLEEALVMAGENGRVNQVGLVRALRRHPSYWAGSGASAELSAGMAALNFGQGGDAWSGGAGMMTDLQGLLSPESNGGAGRAMPPSSTMVDVDASFDDDDSEEYTDMDHQDAAEPGGFMSRMSPRMYMGKPRAASSRAVTDAQLNAAKALAAKTDLVTLIRTRSFSSIPHRLRLHPKEASQPVHTTVRGGYPAKVTTLYLACEYNPTVEVVELLINMFKDGCGIKNVLGGQLALHGACTWNASSGVIGKLLEAYPAAARQRDDLGNLPLHCACFSGASEDIVEALLKTYPLGVSVTNGQGSAPSHIVRRLRHENRTAVFRVLGRYEEDISRRRREAEQVDKPRPLQQDQRQESVEATLRSSSSPNAGRWSGKKSQLHAPGSDRPSVSSARQQSKVHVQPSGPGNDDGSEDGMLWV